MLIIKKTPAILKKGLVVQGNIYRNEGYSDTGDIFGKREKRYNNYIKEVAKHFNNRMKTKNKQQGLNINSGRNQNDNGY